MSEDMIQFKLTRKQHNNALLVREKELFMNYKYYLDAEEEVFIVEESFNKLGIVLSLFKKDFRACYSLWKQMFRANANGEHIHSYRISEEEYPLQYGKLLDAYLVLLGKDISKRVRKYEKKEFGLVKFYINLFKKVVNKWIKKGR